MDRKLEPLNRITARRRPTPTPTILRFSPWSWAKLLFLRDLGPTEVGGFGITRSDNLLYVEDFRLIPQVSTLATVAFDDGAVAEFFDEQIDAGLRPEQFARIWIHTHPESSASPSSVDEQTFARVFGQSDWAVMGILARGGEAYARLQFWSGPGGQLLIPVQVDWSQPFSATDWGTWKQEYERCVQDADRRCDGWYSDWLEEVLMIDGLDEIALEEARLAEIEKGWYGF